jgi:hypothetical protein
MEQSKNVKWSLDEINLLKQLYPNPKNKQQILELLPHRTWGSIRTESYKLGVTMEKPTKCLLDFSNIDSEEKAYILGFIAADGFISNTNKQFNCWVLGIQIAEKDLILLRQIRDLLNPNLKLSCTHYADKPNWSDCYRLTMYDNKLCNDLKAHGITENKSKTLTPSNGIPEELIHHYIRGYFDGDGSFWIRKGDGRLYAGFAGSESMMNYISTWFKQQYKHECTLRKKEGCYLLTYCGFTAINLAKLLYSDATIYLERKYLRAAKFFDKERQEHIIDKLNGDNICKLYKELGTWTKVAEYLGVNVSYISRIKDGKRGKIGKLNCDKFN